MLFGDFRLCALVGCFGVTLLTSFVVFCWFLF